MICGVTEIASRVENNATESILVMLAPSSARPWLGPQGGKIAHTFVINKRQI